MLCKYTIIGNLPLRHTLSSVKKVIYCPEGRARKKLMECPKIEFDSCPPLDEYCSLHLDFLCVKKKITM